MNVMRAQRLDRYAARTDAAVLALALLFLAVYSFQVIWLDLPERVHSYLAFANWAIWAVFLIDVVIRLWLSPSRWAFIKSHPVDIASVVLPVLRPLRALKVFAAGQSLLSSRSGLIQTGQAIVFTAALLVYIGALAILGVEQ